MKYQVPSPFYFTLEMFLWQLMDAAWDFSADRTGHIHRVKILSNGDEFCQLNITRVLHGVRCRDCLPSDTGRAVPFPSADELSLQVQNAASG